MRGVQVLRHGGRGHRARQLLDLRAPGLRARGGLHAALPGARLRGRHDRAPQLRRGDDPVRAADPDRRKATVVSKEDVTHDLRHLVLQLVEPVELRSSPGSTSTSASPARRSAARSRWPTPPGRRAASSSSSSSATRTGCSRGSSTSSSRSATSSRSSGRSASSPARGATPTWSSSAAAPAWRRSCPCCARSPSAGPRARPPSTTARARRRDLCFDKELRALEESLPGFRYVPALSEPVAGEDWDGEVGLITDVMKKHETTSPGSTPTSAVRRRWSTRPWRRSPLSVRRRSAFSTTSSPPPVKPDRPEHKGVSRMTTTETAAAPGTEERPSAASPGRPSPTPRPGPRCSPTPPSAATTTSSRRSASSRTTRTSPSRCSPTRGTTSPRAGSTASPTARAATRWSGPRSRRGAATGPVPERFPGSGGKGYDWPAHGWHEFRDPNEEWELTFYRYNSNVERQIAANIDTARQTKAFQQWNPNWVRLRRAARRRLDARRARPRPVRVRQRPAPGAHEHAQQRDLGELACTGCASPRTSRSTTSRSARRSRASTVRRTWRRGTATRSGRASARWPSS